MLRSMKTLACCAALLATVVLAGCCSSNRGPSDAELRASHQNAAGAAAGSHAAE